MRRSLKKKDTPKTASTQFTGAQALEQLIAKLGTIRTESADVPRVALKCVLYIAFAAEMPAGEDPELEEYLSQLRTDAGSLAAECAGVMRDGYPSGSLTTIQSVIDQDAELGAILENICLIVKPELLSALDAVL